MVPSSTQTVFQLRVCILPRLLPLLAEGSFERTQPLMAGGVHGTPVEGERGTCGSIDLEVNADLDQHKKYIHLCIDAI